MSTSAIPPRGRAARAIGWTMIVLVVVFAGTAIGATSVELLLKARSSWYERSARRESTPRADALERAYAPFDVIHLHPQYVFFFPRRPAERVALSNATCSLDADGFRGPGPAHAGGRRLAFLLGGSSAFGFMASSDATTITGYLNRMQDTYFFVNAGVPSWTSTQEMFRVAFQIAEYRPALIVTYDGANDAALVDYYHDGVDSAGNPEDFEALAARVAESASSPGRAAMTLAASLFPELNKRYRNRFGGVDRNGPAPQPPSERVLQAGVARYLSNLARISELTTAQHGRFISVFQPVAQFHRHLGPGTLISSPDIVERFHKAVLAQMPHDLEFHDFGNVFDQHFAAIPIKNPDITDQTVFVDEVHLYDPGNEIVARHLAALIQ